MLHILSLLLIWITILFVLSSLLFDDDLLVNRSTTEEDDFFWKQGSSSLRLIFQMKFTECAQKIFIASHNGSYYPRFIMY